MRKILSITFALFAGFLILSISAISLAPQEDIDENINLATLVATTVPQVTIIPNTEINDLTFQDNMNIYQYDEPGSVVYMYVTVYLGNSSDNTDHTWQEVNDFTKGYYQTFSHIEVGRAEAIVQIGDENGPLPGELGYGEILPNATIQIRGASTTLSPQKSYKIELRDRAGEWRGQRTIALNKHVFDLTRVRNKLNYDLIKEIPHMVSLRTQFVHLYVKDKTSNPPGDSFVDYGLFTQVEQPNGRFLRNHLLDSEGQLYKTTLFEFYRYPEQIRLVDDPLYDENEFSTILEIKGNKDHTKLILLLDDVNNYNIPIDKTFEKYFDSENYFTWMAYNILVGNIDTQSQNYYLYSPKNGEKWYFIPWDYDGSFDRLERELSERTPYENWEFGLANYWGGVLHNRILKLDSYREKLTAKVEELMLFLNPERIENMLNEYKPIVKKYVSRMPDIYYLPGTLQELEMTYSRFPLEIKSNYDLYYESLETSMPFYLGTPKVTGDVLAFNWDPSYDFDAQDILYEFSIAKDWEFKEIIFSTKIENIISQQIDMLEPGTYFWRVTATNEDGKVQYPFDNYRDAERKLHPGMKYLYITAEGEILEE
jgi:spore coat protein H